MDLINKHVEDYVEHYSSPLTLLLQQVLDETMVGHPHAQMISGHVQGKLLEFFTQMLKPAKVLEIGTFTGFSALCIAGALPENGVLHTIEIREDDARKAAEYFSKSHVGKKIKLHLGDAKSIIPSLEETWDMIFIDADKVSYIDYYELTLPSLKPGGFIIADNVLFHGQVLEKEIKGKNAIAIHAFNEQVASDNRVEQVMLSVRDGLMIIRKL